MLIAWLILKRLLVLIPTLLVIMIVSFLIIRISPGSPFTQERAISAETRMRLEAHYGFDKPMYMQLWRYITHVVQGDLGMSTKYPQYTVNDMLRIGMPTTLLLGVLALLWALVLGLSAGIASAIYHYQGKQHWDSMISMICFLLISTPTFVLGPLLILIFSFHLDILPPAGFTSLRHMVLPACTLGTVYAASIARLTRSGMLNIMQAEFVRTARGKGLRGYTIIRRHMLRGGLLPVITFLGPTTANLLVGSVVVEKIFNIPGIGPYFVDAALNRDYFLVMGIVLVESVFLLVMNCLVDVIYLWLDPRMRDA